MAEANLGGRVPDIIKGRKTDLRGWARSMKKVVLAITLAIFSVTAIGALPTAASVAYGQKGEDKKKKDPPGPPIVKDKGPDQKPKDRPKGKKPE
jgi:hypothetical protein